MKRLLVISVLALAACGEKPAGSAVAEPRVDGERIAFAAGSPQLKALVAAAPVPDSGETLRINARLVWDEQRTVRVFAPLGGRIVTLLATPGQRVRAGDPLAVLSSPDFGQAQAEAARAEADFALADQSLRRARELAEAGVMAEREVQQAEADHARSRAERERIVARARLFFWRTGRSAS